MAPSGSGAGQEAAILSRIIRPERDDLSPEAAQSILQLAFDEQDRARMHELVRKGQLGELIAEEQAELESYRRIGRLVDLMHSKARRALRRAGLAAWARTDAALVALVTQRANAICEYCQLPQAFSSIPFEIDHIIAQKHGGLTVSENLALTCFYCNSYKGPNIAGIDPESRRIVRLYHPCKER